MPSNISRSIFVLLIITAAVAWGQVTLNTSDLAISPGTVISQAATDDYITVNVGSAGANQTWNFASVQTNISWTEYWVSPSSTPQGEEFPDATNCSHQSNNPDSYTYYQTTVSNYLMLGTEHAGVIINVENQVTPNNFPVHYNDSWMGVVHIPSPYSGISIVDTTWGLADGYGTLVDVTGSHACLRVKLKSNTWMIPQTGPSILTSVLQYVWYVPGGEAYVAIVSEPGETNPNFTSGEFTRTTGLTGVQEMPSRTVLPTAITLEPLFPNPFNSQTNLIFTVPKSGNVSLSIFDIQGKLVNTLENGWLNPGRYQAHFDATALPSGYYFARLSAGNTTQTQKLTLVK
jgi:hypothetical protein